MKCTIFLCEFNSVEDGDTIIAGLFIDFSSRDADLQLQRDYITNVFSKIPRLFCLI